MDNRVKPSIGRLKGLLIVVVMILFTLTSVVAVGAQRFSQSSIDGETTEFFKDIMTSERAANDTFLEAYEDYKLAVSQFALHDASSEASEGAYVADVIENFTVAIEGQYHELTETESYMSYLYKIEEENYAELLFYFVDEKLIYIGLTNLQIDINMSEFVPNEILQAWVDDHYTIDALASESFRIAGISQVLYAGAPYQMVMVPSGDSEEDINIDYVIFENDAIVESYMLEFYYSFDAPQDNMIQFLAYFLGISDSYPTVPDE